MSDLSVVKNQNRPTTVGRARAITLTAMLSAVAFVLMFLDFPIPFLIPSFVKMDVSEQIGRASCRERV